jgi:hypothetical protein
VNFIEEKGDSVMAKLQLVEGKQSLEYNHFKDYVWECGYATNTRLMGVVAIRTCWKAPNSDYRLYQILHLDFSEYGIDDYMECYTDPDLKGMGNIQDLREYREEWQRVSGGLGGKNIPISLGATIRLINMVIQTNENYYRYHESDIQEFRLHVVPRMQLMEAAAKEDPSYEEVSSLEATKMVSLQSLSIAETINYFIMRMCDKDYLGAATLSTLSEEELRNNDSWHHEMMTLIHNRIRPQKNSNEYYCTALTEGPVQYYYARINLAIDTSAGKRKSKVTKLDCPYFEPCSEVEMAMQMKHPEYITVYQVKSDVEKFDPYRSQLLADAMMSPAPNGVLFMIYNEDNRHVNSNDYFMNNDVYGACILTPMNELVLMSSEVMKISAMELDVTSSFLSGELTLTGRYRFDSQVFQTFTEMRHATFRDIIQDE